MIKTRIKMYVSDAAHPGFPAKIVVNCCWCCFS